jgi:hypothetical protein
MLIDSPIQPIPPLNHLRSPLTPSNYPLIHFLLWVDDYRAPLFPFLSVFRCSSLSSADQFFYFTVITITNIVINSPGMRASPSTQAFRLLDTPECPAHYIYSSNAPGDSFQPDILLSSFMMYCSPCYPVLF